MKFKTDKVYINDEGKMLVHPNWPIHPREPFVTDDDEEYQNDLRQWAIDKEKAIKQAYEVQNCWISFHLSGKPNNTFYTIPETEFEVIEIERTSLDIVYPVKLARILPEKTEIIYMDREICRKYKDNYGACQNECYFKGSVLKTCQQSHKELEEWKVTHPDKLQPIDTKDKPDFEKVWDEYAIPIPEDDYAGAEGIAELVAGKEIMYKDDAREAFKMAIEPRERRIDELTSFIDQVERSLYAGEDLNDKEILEHYISVFGIIKENARKILFKHSKNSA